VFAARLADFIKKESGINVETDSGGKIGEFTVWVDDKLVVKKKFFKFPDKKKILFSIQQEIQAKAE